MSVSNVSNNSAKEVVTLKKEIEDLNSKVEVISKDKNAEAPSIFIDPEKRAEAKKDEAAMAQEENWINYIISMLERLAASHERVSNSIDGVENPKYNFYATPVPTEQEVKDKEAKKVNDKEVKDKEVKSKDKDDKEVKDKETKEVKDKEVKDKEVKKQATTLVA